MLSFEKVDVLTQKNVGHNGTWHRTLNLVVTHFGSANSKTDVTKILDAIHHIATLIRQVLKNRARW